MLEKVLERLGTSPPSSSVWPGNVPHRRDPERFHVEKSYICQDIENIAEQIEQRASPEITVSRSRRGAAHQLFRK